MSWPVSKGNSSRNCWIFEIKLDLTVQPPKGRLYVCCIEKGMDSIRMAAVVNAHSLGGEVVDKKEIRNTYFRYLIPTIIGMVAHSCYCLADVFFVGQGTHGAGLPALNVALPVFTLYTTFSVLIGVGAATTIAVCRGEGKRDKENVVFTQSVLAVLAIGLLISMIGTWKLRDFAYLLGATDEIADGVVEYLKPINPLAFIFMLSSTMSIIVRSDGNPRLVMTACTIGNLLNILLDYVFVMLLDMGLFGAGLATIIGPCVTLALLSLHFFAKHSQISLTRHFVSIKLMGRMVKNGFGSGVLELSAGFVILLFNVALLKISGSTAVSVFSIISNIAYVGKGIFNGMAQAAQPIISISYGAGWYTRMRFVNRYAMLTAVLFSFAVYAMVALFPGWLIAVFVPGEEEALRIGIPAIYLYFLSFPFTGLNTVLMYYFQSCEKAAYSFTMALLRGIVLVYAALMILPAFMGIHGVWLALFAAEGLTFCIFWPMKCHMEKKKTTFVSHQK